MVPIPETHSATHQISRGSFGVWAQPMRKDVTMYRRISLVVPIPRMIPEYARGSRFVGFCYIIPSWDKWLRFQMYYLRTYFSDGYFGSFSVNLPSGGWQRTWLTTSQYSFKQKLGAARQQAITWAIIDPELCHHMASLKHNTLRSALLRQILQVLQISSLASHNNKHFTLHRSTEDSYTTNSNDDVYILWVKL